MPISFAQIATNTAQLTIQVGEHPVTITYYPGHVTEKTLSAFSGMTAGSDQQAMAAGFASFNQMLVHLIHSWDVFEDDAETVMYPIDADRFADLPLGFRMQVFNAILENLRPEEIAPQVVNS